MKEKDPWKELFDPLQGQWDTEEPLDGHTNRFEARLKAAAELEKQREEEEEQEEPKVIPLWNRNLGWKHLAVAASVALLLGIGLRSVTSPASIEERIVEFAPEVQQTDFHFAGLLEQQVEVMQGMETEETEELIESTLDPVATIGSGLPKPEAGLGERWKRQAPIAGHGHQFSNQNRPGATGHRTNRTISTYKNIK